MVFIFILLKLNYITSSRREPYWACRGIFAINKVYDIYGFSKERIRYSNNDTDVC